jgi:exodeoxyribonuclease VII small subunit
MSKQTFEMAMEKLQRIVDELETGNLPLEEARKKFEEGIKLSNFCSQKLEETEKKITLLTESQTGWIADSAFEPNKES